MQLSLQCVENGDVQPEAASILGTPPRVALEEFLALCASVVDGFDVDRVRRLAAATIAHLGGSARDREGTLLGLEQRWRRSLTVGEPDYGVYDDPDYLAEAWACWVVYSRRYLRSIGASKEIITGLGSAARVVDLGCGVGWTTAALRQIFPGATVVGTNLEGKQARIARRLGAAHGFDVVTDIAAIGAPVDLVFASEYFEHFEAPIAHLTDVIDALAPRVMLIANTFGQPSIGHFDSYVVSGRSVPGAVASRLFRDELRRRGYAKRATTFWNDRPACWAREPGGQ